MELIEEVLDVRRFPENRAVTEFDGCRETPGLHPFVPFGAAYREALKDLRKAQQRADLVAHLFFGCKKRKFLHN